MSAQEKTLASSEESDLLTVLVTQGTITEEQAEQARHRMRRAMVPSHQAVIDLGFTSQEAVFRALSQCNGVPFVVLAKESIADEAVKRVPAKVALHYKFVPISLNRQTLVAAFANPPSLRDRENLRLGLTVPRRPVVRTRLPFAVNEIT